MALVLALACSIGLHWDVLQSVAWVSMLAHNLRSLPVREAVTRTFDGKHPCVLCKAVAAGKKTESRGIFPVFNTLEGVMGGDALRCIRVSSYWELRWPDLEAEAIPVSPPTPPPRAA